MASWLIKIDEISTHFGVSIKLTASSAENAGEEASVSLWNLTTGGAFGGAQTLVAPPPFFKMH